MYVIGRERCPWLPRKDKLTTLTAIKYTLSFLSSGNWRNFKKAELVRRQLMLRAAAFPAIDQNSVVFLLLSHHWSRQLMRHKMISKKIQKF